MTEHFALAYNFTFENLYQREGLVAIDAVFLEELKGADTELFNRLMHARAVPKTLAEKETSQLILDLAVPVEHFLVRLFKLDQEAASLKDKHHALAPLYNCKRLFVQRRAAKAYKPEEAAQFDSEVLSSAMEQLLGAWDELTFARTVMEWLEKQEHADSLELAQRYAAWALYSEAGKKKHAKGILFKQPKKIDLAHLVPVQTEIRDGVMMLKAHPSHLRYREGFALTDPRGTLAQALDHTHYCIYCAHQEKDSCSKGMREKDGAFKVNAQNVTLAGCPLEERISEMNELKSKGYSLAALAAVTIDNPLCAGTGHRICNDCMKACIYQKQEPVNIPLVETRVLDDVLALPYGFEIYSLLTRWNPLHFSRPLPKPETGKRVLVAGLGPAGYTLSHHLINDGHEIVAIDGLKIEPLNVPLIPIKDINALKEPLDKRVLAGFGGVAEYGITVRWDKNYLKIIRLLLERRTQFQLHGGVRFGSTITYNNAFSMGFDHIALCLGAGKPTLLDIPNALARGVRTASDFLMSLQLTGAAKADSIANLQLRLPVVVIGGGLTAIDTATESLAYYPVQVEKFLTRYEVLSQVKGAAAIRARWTQEETEIAEEFLSHARAIRKERVRAKEEGRAPHLIALLESWGGVTLAYRKDLTDAPSYRLNHEEVEKAFEEGIRFAPNLEPTAIEMDVYDHVKAVRFKDQQLPARTVLVAAGTQPNTVLAREDAEHFALDGKYFRAVDEQGIPVTPQRVAKPGDVRVLMHVEPDGKSVSFFGDLHPSFAGNVVKAMASAKQGYPVISRVLEKATPKRDAQPIDSSFIATIHSVERLTPTIVEVIVHAPLAAQNFKPGQFYRLQNFEASALHAAHSTLAMEGLALTGAWVDKVRGLVSVIVLEMGGSSDLCAYLTSGERVILMGPTGSPTETLKNETVVLVGGGLGNAVLFSIGKALRETGSRVLYFAGYKKRIDRYKIEEIEAAADVVVWACDEAPVFVPTRAQDLAFQGNIVQAMLAYAKGDFGNNTLPLQHADRIIVIGSDGMMAAVGAARHTVLKPYLKPNHVAIGSINSPMQCMMKEICAQCLQKHVDPHTGKETYVYSCFNQDQCLDTVSFPHLRGRLAQNGVQEKVTTEWIAYCLNMLRDSSPAI